MYGERESDLASPTGSRDQCSPPAWSRSLTWPRPLAPRISAVPLPGPGVELIRLQLSQ